MADQDPKKDENGDGQPEKDAEASPESPREEQLDQPKGRLEQLKEAFAKDLEYVGLFVFAITAVALILFVVAFNFIPSSEGRVSYRHLRSAELLLTLAATGLVVAIVGRATNAFVLAFGIFLIGALIVPSKDIVRFALIASGSDRDYGSFFQSARSGTDLAGRSSDVANKIITELIHKEFMEILDAEKRKRVIEIIGSEVRKEREITLLEQASALGALDTLDAAAADIERWVYKYGREEKFIEDIRYLRSEGLVSYAYEDLDTIAITPLGHAVLAWKDPALARATGPVGSGVAATLHPLGAMLGAFECPTDIASVPDLSDELLSSNGRLMKLVRNYNFMRFLVPEAGNYRIDVEVKNGDPESTVDPLLVLYDLPREDLCDPIAFDDDGGSFLNSQLFHQLESRTYMIGTATISGDEGNVKVSVKKVNN